MRRTLQDQVADHVKDWLTLILAGLGITFAPYEWLGGMFLALGAAAFAMKRFPEKDKQELWVVMLGAFFASHIVGIASTHWFHEIPVQLPMTLAGFGSRYLARTTMRVFGIVDAKSPAVISNAIDRVVNTKDDEK